MRSAFCFLAFLALASAQCANWTKIYTFEEWDVNFLISFKQVVPSTISIERGWEGMNTQFRLTSFAATLDAAKAKTLAVIGAGEMLNSPEAAFYVTVTPPESEDDGVEDSDGAINSWFLGDFVKEAASVASSLVSRSVARQVCTPEAHLRIILAPEHYDDLAQAIADGLITIEAKSTTYANTTADLDADACLDLNVQALYFTSCDTILLAKGLQLSSSADLLLENIFTTAVNSDPELFEDKYDPVEAPWQKCALEYLAAQLANDAGLATFACAVRGAPATCGSKVDLLNFTYDPANTTALNAVRDLQTYVEDIKKANVWRKFAKYYTNEQVCPFFTWNDNLVCQTKAKEGCNPDGLSCCNQNSCGSKDETTGFCPSGTMDWSDPYNLTAAPETLRKRVTTLSGPACAKNHPLIGKPGVCIHKNTCTSKGGKYVRGLCPAYGADILCCAGKGFAYKYESNSKLCADYAGDQVQSIKGNGGVTYQVVKIHKIHLSDPSAYGASPTSRDNTMEVSTACAFSKMRNAGLKAGISIKINSGFRTLARQEYFWNCYKCRCCNGGNLAARPGTSNHGRGLALDLNTNCGSQGGNSPPSACTRGGVYRWLRANAKNYGFVRTVKSEPWHWEHRPGTGAPSWQ